VTVVRKGAPVKWAISIGAITGIYRPPVRVYRERAAALDCPSRSGDPNGTNDSGGKKYPGAGRIANIH
jgi:hypothetical protein